MNWIVENAVNCWLMSKCMRTAKGKSQNGRMRKLTEIISHLGWWQRQRAASNWLREESFAFLKTQMFAQTFQQVFLLKGLRVKKKASKNCAC